MENNQEKSTQEVQLLTLSEVAKMLKVHPNTLRHWDKNGILPAIRLGEKKIHGIANVTLMSSSVKNCNHY